MNESQLRKIVEEMACTLTEMLNDIDQVDLSNVSRLKITTGTINAKEITQISI